MKMLDHRAFEEIRSWMNKNARPLELSIWNYCYEEGSAEEIVKALSFYQNEDGGFGNGVEPDCWNPESSPYATLTAIGILKRIKGIETVKAAQPVVMGIIRYLESGAHRDGNGWHFTVPSNDGYPRAPWHSWNMEVNRLQDMGVTAMLCSFIFNSVTRDTKLFQEALEYAGRILDAAGNSENFGEMGIGGICSLLYDIKRLSLPITADCDGLAKKMESAVNRTMERDPSKWSSYTPRPSDFIAAPDSPFYKGNEAIVEAELDYLIETRNPGGVWNITWTWFDLGEKYAKAFAVSENWWMGIIAINKLAILKSFGRMEA